MLHDSVVIVMCTYPRAMSLAMKTMRKSTHSFSFSFLYEHGTPLGGPLGSWNSANIHLATMLFLIYWG